MQPTISNLLSTFAKLTNRAPAKASSVAPRQVLIVDGDATTGGYTHSLVEAGGYQARLVADVASAWSQLATARPALIVLNVETIAGAFPLLACLKNDRTIANIPVIVVATQDYVPMLLCAIDLKASDFLPLEDLSMYLLSSIAELMVVQPAAVPARVEFGKEQFGARPAWNWASSEMLNVTFRNEGPGTYSPAL